MILGVDGMKTKNSENTNEEEQEKKEEQTKSKENTLALFILANLNSIQFEENDSQPIQNIYLKPATERKTAKELKPKAMGRLSKAAER